MVADDTRVPTEEKQKNIPRSWTQSKQKARISCNSPKEMRPDNSNDICVSERLQQFSFQEDGTFNLTKRRYY